VDFQKIPRERKHMRTTCGIISWIIWIMATALIALVATGAPEALKQSLPAELANENPLKSIALGIIMLLFSGSATFLRRRLFQRQELARLAELGPVFLWLCLVSFASCFAFGAAMMGITHALLKADLQIAWIFFGITGVVMLLAIPLLPKRQA
jgi:hypothetical protein